MSKLENVILQGPTLCGAVNGVRWGRGFELQFRDELANKDSVFQMGDESISNRLETLSGLFRAEGVVTWKARYWIQLLTLCAVAYARSKLEEGDTSLDEDWSNLKKTLEAQEDSFPKMAAVMSVAEASTLTNWG